MVKSIVKKLFLFLWGLGWLTKSVVSLAPDLARARGRISPLSFVIHEFMDASCLDCDRVRACAFKVMTRDGPVSMCMHNAKRDDFILQPISVRDANRVNGQEIAFWQPLTGAVENLTPQAPPAPESHGLKRVKGRTRARVLETRDRRQHSTL
jgi:7,8-dihydro-6-hydroxymethylpterin dimethyltransferase